MHRAVVAAGGVPVPRPLDLDDACAEVGELAGGERRGAYSTSCRAASRAAELLHLVQPAVTRQIRALEHELGVSLFERTRSGVRPTGAGTSLAERAARVHRARPARAELTPAPGTVAGLVTVGLLKSMVGLLTEPLHALPAGPA